MYPPWGKCISSKAFHAGRPDQCIEAIIYRLSPVTPLSVQIRGFEFPSDYEQVIELWQSIERGVHLGRSDTLTEIEKKISRDPDLFLVAESEGDIIGAVIGGFDGRRGLIYHLAVAANFRGYGIGSDLMNEVEARLRSKGCLKCYLMVTLDNLEVAHYYEKRGWQPMEHVELYGKELQ